MAPNISDHQNQLGQQAHPLQDTGDSYSNQHLVDSSTGGFTTAAASRYLASAEQYGSSSNVSRWPLATTVPPAPIAQIAYPAQAAIRNVSSPERSGHGPTINASSDNYSSVELPKKRPRRRPEDIDRIYKCEWGGCDKAYGLLSSLNSHVLMQRHGEKRTPAQYKQLRKEQRMRQQALEEEFQDEIEEARRRAQEGGCNSADDCASPRPAVSVQPYLPPVAQQVIDYTPRNVQHHTRADTRTPPTQYNADSIDLDSSATNEFTAQPEQIFENAPPALDDGIFRTDAGDLDALEASPNPRQAESQQNGAQQHDPILRQEPPTSPDENVLPDSLESGHFEYLELYPYPVDVKSQQQPEDELAGLDPATEIINNGFFDSIDLFQSPIYHQSPQYVAQQEDAFPGDEPAIHTEEKLPEFVSWAYVDGVLSSIG